MTDRSPARSSARGLFTADQLPVATERTVESLLSLLSLSAFVLGAAGLVGWHFDIPSLRHLDAELPAIRPISALCLTLMAGALNLGVSRPKLGRLLALATLVIACSTLFPELGPLERFLRSGIVGTSATGLASDLATRAEPTPASAALGFLILAVTALTARMRHLVLLAQVVTVSTVFGGMVPLLASVYRMQTAEAPFFPAAPSLQATLGVVLLGVGILLLNPQRGVMGLLSSDTAASQAARRMMFPAVAIPIFLGGLFVYARKIGTLQMDTIVPAFVAAVAATLASAILWVARQGARTELEARHSEAALRSALDDSPLMMWMSDEHGHPSHINPALLEFLGIDLADALGPGWQSRMHPDDIVPVDHARRAPGAQQRSFSMEFRVMGADGQWHWVLSTGVPRTTNSRKLAGFTGTWIEITTRREAQARLERFAEELERRVEERTADLLRSRDDLARQSQLLESVVNNMGDGLMAIRSDGSVILVNDTAMRIFGATQAPDSASEDTANYGFFLDDGVTPYASEQLPVIRALRGESTDNASMIARNHHAPDGISLRVTGRPMRDADGNVIGSIIVGRDVTDFEKAMESTRQLAAAVRSSADAILSVELDGVIATWNMGAEQIYGYTSEEAVGLTLDQLEPSLSADDLQALLSTVLQGAEFVRRETIGRRKDGSPLDIATTMSPIRDQAEAITAVSVVHHDVTPLKEVERRIQGLNDELEQRVRDRTAALTIANQDLENYASSVAHDLRTPLRGIAGFARVLEEDYANAVDDEGRRVIAVIRKNAQDMAAFIDALLAFSAAERQPPNKTTVDAAAMARECVDSLAHDCADRQVVFHVGDLPPCRADAALLKQVFLNLLSNAVKFTRRCEVAHIEIGSRHESTGELAYFVRDNGVGFDMSNTRRLFGIFQRLHAPTDFEGTGLGLAGVARIVAAHGGRIWADAAPNKGATFAFVIE